MAHQVQQMAYVGETPWHGLGNELTPQQPIEVWAEQSGMSFQILETPVRFMPWPMDARRPRPSSPQPASVSAAMPQRIARRSIYSPRPMG